VTVLDGAGQVRLCTVRKTSHERVELGIVERKSHAAPAVRITLLQAVPKGKLFEEIVHKATELGAARIVPILAERVVGRLGEEEAAHKTERWRQAAIEAIKQCGSPWLPEVERPLRPAAFLARGEKFELPLVAALEGERRHPREYFREFRERHGRGPASVCIWIGPEGDFTPEEVQELKSAGMLPMTLGRLVLRTDTASAYCLSIVHYELETPAGRG